MSMRSEPLRDSGVDGVDADADRALVSDLQRQRGAELFAFARRLGLSPDAAEDAVQESLLRLWSALDGGDPIAKPDAWVFRTLYRICMDDHRWHRRVARLVDRMRPSTERSSPAGGVERMAVWDAVDRLPHRQRAAVYLRYRADLAYDDIGAILGIHAVSARSTVSRALDRLGATLSKEDFR
jgi:RNA polymerase sigma-70 factor (ECF subfamily)